ncbi:OmpA family protein [Sphingomonas sp. CJ20]
MVRLVFFGLFIAAIVAATLGLRACQQRSAIAATADTLQPPMDVEILPNGAPLFAPDGSIAQHLVDWLDRADQAGARQSAYFELGGTQFRGKAVVPEPVAAARIPRLVDMLKAYPRTNAHIIGFTGAQGDRRSNRKLSEARARWLVDALVAGGIEPSRLSFEGRDNALLPAGTSIAAPGPAQSERVGLVLSMDAR